MNLYPNKGKILENNLLEDLQEQYELRRDAIDDGDESTTVAANLMFLHGTAVAEMATAYGFPQAAYSLYAKTSALTSALDASYDIEAAQARLRPLNRTGRSH